MGPTYEALAETSIRCRIQRETTNDITTLRGIAFAKTDTAGGYTLLVVKTGPGGTSRLSQGGRFQAAAGAQTGLGEVGFNLEPNAGFEATLTLEVEGHRISCEASVAPTTPL
ncbi:curli-like amyloid fiber formation chaperone CsgH [Methylobacterium sp. Leaf99]|uniref:curli-like amyloid fiber formation chaperone CsgH n=1 Tax=Methylobacterium sp. Leaf99 TaxID=1736251 RepID=UPI003FD3F315